LVAAGYNDNAGQLNLAELYDTVTGTWSPTGTLSDERDGQTATLLPSGQVLVVGGYQCCGGFGGYYSLPSAEVYNPISGTWAPTSMLNGARGNHTATLLPTGRVLVTGGLNEGGFFGSDIATSEEYDPATGNWLSAGSMATGRDGHTATLLANGAVLIAGGYGTSGGPFSSAELYDAQSGGTWAQANATATARTAHTSTRLSDGQVLVAGGWNGLGPTLNYLSSAERFDPTTGIWSSAGDMTSPRQTHTASLLADGRLLVAGGTDGTGEVSSAELYDAMAGTWTATGGMSDARANHTAVELPDGRVLVAGGNDTSTSLTSAELYDPVAGTWSATGSMNTWRQYHTATLLPDGRVLVAGGAYFDGSGFVPMADTELYDPLTELWTPTGAMEAAHLHHTATLLPNGKVLVAGGTTNTAASAELYDPSTGTWALTSPMLSTRSLHTATLLTNGMVLVAGGVGGLTLSSAELYDPVTGSWTLTASLIAGRNSFAATLLLNGDVLATGGQNYNNSGSVPPYLAAAELYLSSSSAGPILPPMALVHAQILSNGSFQFAFTNPPSAVFSVLATTFPTLPSSEWMVLSGVTETSPGHFQFTDSQATNFVQRFYRLRSP
jgi:WD40 repeat protein